MMEPLPAGLSYTEQQKAHKDKEQVVKDFRQKTLTEMYMLEDLNALEWEKDAGWWLLQGIENQISMGKLPVNQTYQQTYQNIGNYSEMFKPETIEWLNKTVNEILTKINRTHAPKQNYMQKSAQNMNSNQSVLEWIKDNEWALLMGTYGDWNKAPGQAQTMLKQPVARGSARLKSIFTGNEYKFDIAEYKDALLKAGQLIERTGPAFDNTTAPDPINI